MGCGCSKQKRIVAQKGGRQKESLGATTTTAATALPSSIQVLPDDERLWAPDCYEIRPMSPLSSPECDFQSKQPIAAAITLAGDGAMPAVAELLAVSDVESEEDRNPAAVRRRNHEEPSSATDCDDPQRAARDRKNCGSGDGSDGDKRTGGTENERLARPLEETRQARQFKPADAESVTCVDRTESVTYVDRSGVHSKQEGDAAEKERRPSQQPAVHRLSSQNTRLPSISAGQLPHMGTARGSVGATGFGAVSSLERRGLDDRFSRSTDAAVAAATATAVVESRIYADKASVDVTGHRRRKSSRRKKSVGDSAGGSSVSDGEDGDRVIAPTPSSVHTTAVTLSAFEHEGATKEQKGVLTAVPNGGKDDGPPPRLEARPAMAARAFDIAEGRTDKLCVVDLSSEKNSADNDLFDVADKGDASFSSGNWGETSGLDSLLDADEEDFMQSLLADR